MKIVFIGIQGSGKGTQARILERDFGFKVFETGTFLREIAKKDTDLGRQVKQIIDSGNQVSSDVIENILKDIISSFSNGNLIFDGFVRNAQNKEMADRILGNYKVLFLHLSEEKAKNRLLGRMYDTQTGETFPSGTEINPKNGNKLIKRADDEENAINQRIRLFYDVTMPIVEEYRKKGNLIEIDADGDIEFIAKNIKEKLGL